MAATSVGGLVAACFAFVGEARGLRHGRPFVFSPLHVVDGFLESDRGSRASGVWGMWGIV